MSMSDLARDLIVALVPILLVQTGALIYFSGIVSAMLRSHDRRIEFLERRTQHLNNGC